MKVNKDSNLGLWSVGKTDCPDTSKVWNEIQAALSNKVLLIFILCHIWACPSHLMPVFLVTLR